jgi:GntR family transcriptional regulator, transcriptional repressor for pyruvate dehydrogenase complex
MTAKRRTKASTPATTPSTAERVLDWIQQYITKHGLKPGDGLPKEMEIAKAAGTGRSSVREALTALKALGIVVSRRKGGIRIIREPVLLDMRRYLTECYASKEQFRDALEFRAVMEWGLGSLLLANVDDNVLREAQVAIDRIRQAGSAAGLMEAERQFHTCLTRAAGNPLAGMLTFLYTPLFDEGSFKRFFGGGPEEQAATWIEQHQDLLDALKQRDRTHFLYLLDRHTRCYMRLGKDQAYTRG